MIRIKRSFLKKNWLFRFVFVFVLSLLFGCLTVWFAKRLPLFESEETEPDFFMGRYFTYKSNNVKDRETPRYDTILLLDVSNLRREELAEMLDSLDSQHPKIIGFDVMHQDKEYEEYDSKLVQALRNCKSPLVLPIFEDKNHNAIASFYKNDVDKPAGSVVFDNPWYNRTKHGEYYTFAYQVAKAYCGKEVMDTTSFLVDYSPMFLKRIYFDNKDSRRIFKFEPGSNTTEVLSINGRIVLVGTTSRKMDGIYLDYPVMFKSSTNASKCIPGMVAISYQIRSFLEKEHRIHKIGPLWNGLLCMAFVILYMVLLYLIPLFIYYTVLHIEKKLSVTNKRLSRLLWVYMPLLKLVFLFVIEYLLIVSLNPIVDKWQVMPNLWIAMASIPYVNCFDMVFSRMMKNKEL